MKNNDTIERLGNGFVYARSFGEGYNSGFGDGGPPTNNVWGNGRGCGMDGHDDGNGFGYGYGENGSGRGHGWVGLSNGFAILVITDPLLMICMENNV